MSCACPRTHASTYCEFFVPNTRTRQRFTPRVYNCTGEPLPIVFSSYTRITYHELEAHHRFHLPCCRRNLEMTEGPLLHHNTAMPISSPTSRPRLASEPPRMATVRSIFPATVDLNLRLDTAPIPQKAQPATFWRA